MEKRNISSQIKKISKIVIDFIIKYKKIIILDIIGLILYHFIDNYLQRQLIAIVFIAINLTLKDSRGLAFALTPLLLWQSVYKSYPKIPLEWRRPVDTETTINIDKNYFNSWSLKLYDYKNTYIDIFTWIPYGILHYIIAIGICIYLIVYCKKIEIYSYVFFFGLYNFLGVITQTFWPTAPPWYFRNYQGIPATYDIPGNPGDLVRIDELFHVKFYQSAYKKSSIVWGAWPSLHSGKAVYIATFLSFQYPKFSPLFLLYIPWVMFSTFYLGHHFIIDAIGGFCYAFPCAVMAALYIRYKANKEKKKINDISNYENDPPIYIKCENNDTSNEEDQNI